MAQHASGWQAGSTGDRRCGWGAGRALTRARCGCWERAGGRGTRRRRREEREHCRERQNRQSLHALAGRGERSDGPSDIWYLYRARQRTFGVEDVT